MVALRIKERKKVIIHSTKLANKLANVEKNTPVDNIDFLNSRIKECKSVLETLLNIHTEQSNCCPDITRRLKNAIEYVSDVVVVTYEH